MKNLKLLLEDLDAAWLELDLAMQDRKARRYRKEFKQREREVTAIARFEQIVIEAKDTLGHLNLVAHSLQVVRRQLIDEPGDELDERTLLLDQKLARLVGRYREFAGQPEPAGEALEPEAAPTEIEREV